MILNELIRLEDKELKDGMLCIYHDLWHGIPLYLTNEYNNVRAVLFEDGSCAIVIGDGIVRVLTTELIECALWHEVSHLWHNEDTKSMEHECRADMVAVRATSMRLLLESLNTALILSKNTELMSERIEKIKLSNGNYTLDIEPVQMLKELKPAIVSIQTTKK